MANNFVDHKDRWLLIANGEFEYPILFIKSWLPFNAWYCNNYPQHRNKDRPILEEMKVDNNLFTTRIISLLQNSDEDSTIFQNNLVKLYSFLESYKVPNAIDNISFRSLNFRTNPTTSYIKSYRGHNYKVEIISPVQPYNYRIRVDILNPSGGNIFLYNHTKYDKSHLIADADFMQLSLTNKNIILEGLEKVNPKLKESLLVVRRNESLQTISNILFTNDTPLLAKAIIEVLYNIRCILFHGEIQPSKDNLKIYEPAFYMLKQLIKSLD
ncbi:MAG: hypothetical protein CFE23_11625 [Flavobacterium sp. BFFFF1]|uniref:hypothetical protein n=1 Tax=Flavobacterium sp. BFFFF1 TaxID=2015557 RepID=UPI000BD9F040|nr:hypothetical protein [Flavobacterium sp. BFFFF1]OYU79898.1 MAG: hypothetical protein CFE23_11625 [Flavobacterium sp. BFFFF1]